MTNTETKTLEAVYPHVELVKAQQYLITLYKDNLVHAKLRGRR